LLVGWDALLVLDFRLDIVDGIGRLHLKGDRLAREGLDEAGFVSLEFGIFAVCSRRKPQGAYICIVPRERILFLSLVQVLSRRKESLGLKWIYHKMWR
jgi:hypothetical protein